MIEVEIVITDAALGLCEKSAVIARTHAMKMKSVAHPEFGTSFMLSPSYLSVR